MNIFTSAGMAVGIMIGLIICVIFYKFANNDRKILTEYDERQEKIRGKGYKYAFYSLLAYEVIMACLVSGGYPVEPFDNYIMHILGVFISLLVLCVYTIWKGAYWGLNNNKKKYTVLIIIGFVCNLIPVIVMLVSGGIKKDGISSFPVTNLIVVIWMVIIGIVYMIRRSIDGRNGEE